MKGVIFNSFEKFIIENFGEDAFDGILEETPMKTKDPFVGPGTYPDSDLLGMVMTASDHLQIPVEDAVKAFGKFLFGYLAAMTPKFVEIHDHPKDFLMTVEDVIHVEVRKLYDKAETPKFDYEELPENGLKIIYNSSRKMFTLMEGLIEGVGDYFGYEIEQNFKQIGNSGHFSLAFSKR